MKTLKNYSKEKALKLINRNKKIKEFYDSMEIDYENNCIDYVNVNANYTCVSNENSITYCWTDYNDIRHFCTTINFEEAMLHSYYIIKYNGKVKKERYHWIDNITGELQKNIFCVIKEILYTKKHYGFWNLNWKYSRKGF